MTIFDFDLSILDSPDFKEDAVREELITPLLHKLGYKPGGDFSIIRSKSLTHPYVMIGSKKQKVNIIPDYLLKVKSKYAWVLDAKNPSENIVSGKNVEQVYSYAIHPEVRVNLYALCNGHELSLFHISRIKPVMYSPLKELAKRWAEVEQLLSGYTVLTFRLGPSNPSPDYGLHLYKLGYANPILTFFNVPISHISRVNDLTFSLTNNIAPDGVEYAFTFDFDIERLRLLVDLAPEYHQTKILNGLNQQPYKVDIIPPFNVNVEGKLGLLAKTKHEEFMPLIVKRFF